MVNFKNAYDEMNIDEYSNTLHTGFIFVFADGSSVAPTTGIYTREEDLQSTTRMFNGEQGQDPDGLPMPGVRAIEFTELMRLIKWEDVIDGGCIDRVGLCVVRSCSVITT